MKVLQDYKTYLAVHYRKKYTRKTYFSHVRKIIENIGKPVEKITQNDLNNWMARQNIDGMKPNGIQTRAHAINKFFKWYGKPLKLKLPGWKPTTRNTLSLDEIDSLREVARNISTEHELVLLFITDLDARPSEIIKAKWSNIKGNKIYFDDSKTGDNYGYVTPRFMEALEKYRLERPEPKIGYNDYILIGWNSNSKGMKYTDTGGHIRKIVKEIAMVADLGRSITPYDLRASVITEEFNNLINPKAIQRKARHSLLETTLRYNHLDDRMLIDYIENGLIFDRNKQDKKRIYRGDKTPQDKPVFIEPKIPQDLYKTFESEDNSSFSFSTISFRLAKFIVFCGIHSATSPPSTVGKEKHGVLLGLPSIQYSYRNFFINNLAASHTSLGVGT